MQQIPQKRYQVSKLENYLMLVPATLDFSEHLDSFDTLNEAKNYFNEQKLDNCEIIDFIDASPNDDAKGKLVYVKYPEYRLEMIT